MKLFGKTIVVTGASGGIGSSLVSALLEHGARVAAVDFQPENLQKLKLDNDKHSSNLFTYCVDISDRKAANELPRKVLTNQGDVDGVINCAGIIQPFVKVQDLEYDVVEHVMDVNFYGTLYITKAFLPYLLKRPEAHIVNVSSMGGFLPVPGQSAYGASKAAVKLLTEGLYAELLETSVHVSVVYPGATDTDIAQNSGVEIPMLSRNEMQKMRSATLSPQKAAKIILKGIEKNKPQIFTGTDSKFMNRLYRVNPVFATRFIARKMKSLLNSH
ncbi:SDR family NAD(P)-dependent oxidoreductase [Candidatus Saccharibacteria bacterium]|nr:SDR family NAD(P)-dependent oxidoreductase [Candidatus Saccharibacteria bacterium]